MTSDRGQSTGRRRPDPVVFEILRRRLGAINDEAAITVMRVSGSQIVTEAGDLNSVLLSAEGEVLVSGMYMLVHTCALNGLVRFILDNYADNPGFGPGDMFLTNDPYVTGLHQADAVLVAPIYDGDRLIAWCGTTVHEPDVGGPVPGSIAVGSSSIYDEPIPMAPVKIVEGGRTRRDLERAYLIRSRSPELVALDLLGQIAANRLQSERILQLCRRYGTETVIAAMAWLVDSTEDRLRARLRELPDGRFRHVGYVEHDGLEDKAYAISLTMTKVGETIELDFTDSSAQAPGLINSPFGMTRGFVLASVMPLLGYDGLAWVPAGFERVISLRTRPGTITHAEWPAGVSLGATSSGHEVRTCVNVCLAHMLEASADHSDKVIASCISSAPGQTISGRRADGSPFTSMLLDAMCGGGGARTFGDGGDTYGMLHVPGGACANVEVNEANFPLLYLWRAEQADSGGPGAYRGGVGASHAFTPHNAVGSIELTLWAHGVEQPASSGVLGGEPGSENAFLILRRGADRLDPTLAGRLDASLPGAEVPMPKARTELAPGEVLLSWCAGGGGLGDPLERDPVLVLADVINGLVTAGAATRDYGVVLRVDGATSHDHDAPSLTAWQLDADATARCRVERRRARLSGADPRPPLAHHGVVPATRTIAGTTSCGRCGTVLADLGAEARDRLVSEEQSPGYRFPLADAQVGSDKFVVRRSFCPACGRQLAVEVELAGTRSLRAVDLFSERGGL